MGVFSLHSQRLTVVGVVSRAIASLCWDKLTTSLARLMFSPMVDVLLMPVVYRFNGW